MAKRCRQMHARGFGLSRQTAAATAAASTAAAQERSRQETAHRGRATYVVQSRQDGGFGFYPTRGRVAQNARQREGQKLTRL